LGGNNCGAHIRGDRRNTIGVKKEDDREADGPRSTSIEPHRKNNRKDRNPGTNGKKKKETTEKYSHGVLTGKKRPGGGPAGG